MANRRAETHPAERLIFFTDAVVAIAMTLLILPLLESVSEATRQGLNTLGYLQAHGGQLAAFAISFFVIASFWRTHDRLFEHVAHHGGWLAPLNIVWMFTIVWLPVATAMVGAMHTDRFQLGVYIGSMLTTSLLALAMQLLLLRNPHLSKPENPASRDALPDLFATSGLFTLALVLGLAIPGVHYWGLLVLLLSSPVERLLQRRVR